MSSNKIFNMKAVIMAATSSPSTVWFFSGIAQFPPRGRCHTFLQNFQGFGISKGKVKSSDKSNITLSGRGGEKYNPPSLCLNFFWNT